MPTTHVNGIQIHYEVNGTGDPLVLLPGFAVAAWIWFKQIPILSQKFTTIAVDNRGTGQSDTTEGRHTIKDMADDLAGLLNALSVTRAHILGTSLGGFIAQEFALAYPEMTRSLVLCCTGFGGPNYELPSEDILAIMSGMEGLGLEERARQNVSFFFSPTYLTQHANEVETVIQKYLENPTSEHAHINHLVAAMAFDAEARVSGINVPTLVITGDQDACVLPQNAKNLAEKIPTATFVTIAGAGHAVFMERAEEFNHIVTTFLEEANA